MYSLAEQSIEIDRQDSDQRFSFSGFHFGNNTSMQNDTTK
jgi:hypothetical protein